MALTVTDCPRCGSHVEEQAHPSANLAFACINASCDFLLTLSSPEN